MDYGQNPPGLKWKKMETPHFRILFPAELLDEARRTAGILESFLPGESYPLRDFPEKTPIILQNQTVVSNGFVTLAPRRAEFYTTPPQDNGPTDWITRLAVHEMRHVAQINQVVQTKKIDLPLIQEFQFAMFGAAMPVWLIEGDAVVTETALTSGGRGILPSWEKEFRANVLSGKEYSYSKYFFGSLKDNVPDYYRMGYFMSSWIRRHYSDSVFRAILETSSLRAPLPGSFSSSLRKFTGLGNAGLFRATQAELKTHWSEQMEQLTPRTYSPLNHRRNDVKTDYLYPHFAGAGTFICLKRGYADAATFIRVDSAGKETKLLAIGPQQSPWFDYAAGKIVWDELKYDPRYRYRDYSVINIFDTKTRAFHQLTHRSRLFSPSLSADGTKIVAVKITEGNQNSIVLLDASTGKQLWESRSFDRQIHSPSPDAKARRIVFMLTGDKGRSMGVLDIAGGSFRQIREPDRFDSGQPLFTGEGQIIFQSHFNGIDNIYALDPETGQIRQLTRARFGAAHPDYNEQTSQLVFNDFVPEGMNIARTGLKPAADASRTAPVENTFRVYAAPVLDRTTAPAADASQRDTAAGLPRNGLRAKQPAEYPVSDYKGAGRLFNFHSISPTGAIEDDNYILGVRLKSNNLLNTLAFRAGYNYNLSLGSGEYTAGFEYKRFYPVLSATYLNRKREGVFRQGETVSPFNWREHEVEFAATIPLSFTKRNYLYAVGISTGSSYTSRYALQEAPGNFIRDISFPWINRFSFTRLRMRSARDLAPRFGQYVSVLHRSLAFDSRLDGKIIAVSSLLYFPGLFRHHSFSASFNFQEGSGQYRGLNEIPEISGSSHLRRTAPIENTLLLDYRFPLACPDWELGTFAYIKRIKAGLFADYENLRKAGAPDTYGFEVRVDANFLRLYMPEFDIGTKVVFFNDRQSRSPAFELILNYNLAL